MTRNPQQRLERLVHHARAGWRRAQAEPEARRRARRWLVEHPSARPDIDRLWLACLAGRGPLAAWLDAGGDPATWTGSPPLHGVLASHPFPDLPQWSTLPTSAGS